MERTCSLLSSSTGPMSSPALWASESFTRGSRSMEEVRWARNMMPNHYLYRSLEGVSTPERLCEGLLLCFSVRACRVCLWRPPVPVLRDLWDHAGRRHRTRRDLQVQVSVRRSLSNYLEAFWTNWFVFTCLEILYGPLTAKSSPFESQTQTFWCLVMNRG